MPCAFVAYTNSTSGNRVSSKSLKSSGSLWAMSTGRIASLRGSGCAHSCHIDGHRSNARSREAIRAGALFRRIAKRRRGRGSAASAAMKRRRMADRLHAGRAVTGRKPMQDIAERFTDPRPIILDGATSTELQRRGVPMSADTWSGLAAITHPDILRELHVAYLRAGAEVIIANTYAAAPQHVARGGIRRPRPGDQRPLGGACARSARGGGGRTGVGRRLAVAHGPRIPLVEPPGPDRACRGAAQAGGVAGRGRRRSPGAGDAARHRVERRRGGCGAVGRTAGVVGIQLRRGRWRRADDSGQGRRAGAVRGRPARGDRPRGDARGRDALRDRRHRARTRVRPSGVRSAARRVAQLRDHRAAGLAVHQRGDPPSRSPKLRRDGSRPA